MWTRPAGAALIPVLLAVGLPASASAAQPEVVTVRSVGVELHGLLWYPAGQRVPGILFNHDLGCVPQPECDYREPKIRQLGELFSRHGYAFLVVFRRGEGLSAGAGRSAGEQLEMERSRHGSRDADRLQVHLLESEQLDDARTGLTYLRGLPRVDADRIAVVGHSFGGSLSLVLAERVWNLRALVGFSAGPQKLTGFPAPQNWNLDLRLRDLLTGVAQRLRVPTLLVYASNDYTVQPGKTLCDATRRGVGSCELAILPANGTTIEEGHDFVYSGSDSWGPVVFDFLSKRMGASQ